MEKSLAIEKSEYTLYYRYTVLLTILDEIYSTPLRSLRSAPLHSTPLHFLQPKSPAIASS